MQEKLLDFLVCPACKGFLKLSVQSHNEEEIELGTLACLDCSSVYDIVDGIPIMLPPEPSLEVSRKRIGQREEAQKIADSSQLEIRNADAQIFRDRLKKSEIIEEGIVPIIEPWNVKIKKDIADDVVIRNLRQERSHSLLDVGGGYGRLAMKILTDFDHLVSCDFAIERLKLCREITLSRGMVNIHMVQCDARYLPFVDGGFDVAVSQEVVSHVPGNGREQAVAELSRCLRSGGGCYVTVGNYNLSCKRSKVIKREADKSDKLYYVKFTHAEFTSLLSKSLSVEQVRGIDCIPRRIWRKSKFAARFLEKIIQRTPPISDNLGFLLSGTCRKL